MLAIVVGGMVLVTLIREAREMERLGFELGVVSLMLVATGLAGLVGLECAGWEYYGRMQGWTMNTLPFFIRREYGLMVAGSAFSILFASGWWFWMRQHVVRNGVRGWLKQSLWLVPVGLLVMSAAGFTVLNRIKIEGGARADRIFELRLRTVRLGLEMAGLQTDGGGPELVKALGRQAMANPDLDAIAFVRMAGGRLETVASTATAISIPTHPYLWRERGDLDPRFAEGRTAFGSSFMQDAEGAFALYCEPWPHPGEGWLVFRVSFETWAETMGPVLMQATFIIVLAGVLAVSAVVFMIQRELGTDSRLSIARAEAASRAKTELLSRASHELRTPIQGVLGYAELLERSELSPGQLEWVQAVRNQGAHLLRLVNDLLDLGALQNGRLSIEAAMMSPINVAREAMAGVRPLAQAKKLSCLMAVDETVPAWVLGDATRLRQVLVNLLGNAVKFTDAGEVRLGLRARLEGDCWRLSFEVSDTGPGIAPEDLRWIFESPRRARRLPTEGAGLGLALARGLCEAMGGDLQAQSRLGRGSTFVATVVLPEMVTPETAAAPVAPEELPRLG
ncbi:MAG TPA: ATP-binding protein, partial [Rariglobus sp.]